MTPMETGRAKRAQECFDRMVETSAELGKFAADFSEAKVQSFSVVRLCRQFLSDFDTRERLLDELDMIRIALAQKAQGMEL